MQLQLTLPILDINLSLPERGVIAIFGPSGAGKTTLLRAVAGLESAARGRVEINGEIWQDDAQNIFLPTHQRSIGFVFQESSLFPHLTVQANLEFGLRRIPVSNQKVSLSQAVELLGIASLLKRAPATLSGGEKQRVSIARALATSPKLLLMDEPLASLDEQRKAEVLPYLERLAKELEIPILYVSHASDEVAWLADYVVVLEEGRVRASGSVFDLISRDDRGDNGCTLISAQIIAHDVHRQLSQVEFAGGQLWLPQIAAEVGAMVRLRIQARDVSCVE
jgi:molybdate transport system ATP-binding protein